MAAVSGVRLNQQDPELPLAPDGGWGWVVCAGRDGHNQRLIMEVDLQSPCHVMCTAVLTGWDHAIPPIPPHWDSYTRALLVSNTARTCTAILCNSCGGTFARRSQLFWLCVQLFPSASSQHKYTVTSHLAYDSIHTVLSCPAWLGPSPPWPIQYVL